MKKGRKRKLAAKGCLTNSDREQGDLVQVDVLNAIKRYGAF